MSKQDGEFQARAMSDHHRRGTWAALEWNPKTRASRVLGFLRAKNGPDANLRAWKRFRPTAKTSLEVASVYCRPAWDTKTHYSTVRLEEAR